MPGYLIEKGWCKITLSEILARRFTSNVDLFFSTAFSHVIKVPTLTEVISIWILRTGIIYTIMNFYWSMLLPFKNSPISSYKFSWILTLTEIRSFRILRLSLISAIMNFYGSHVIALQKLSNERSYKFSWILTLTEVLSIWILRMSLISAVRNFYGSHAISLKKLSNIVLISLAEF